MRSYERGKNLIKTPDYSPWCFAKTERNKIGYHRKGHLKRRRMAQISAPRHLPVRSYECRKLINTTHTEPTKYLAVIPVGSWTLPSSSPLLRQPRPLAGWEGHTSTLLLLLLLLLPLHQPPLRLPSPPTSGSLRGRRHQANVNNFSTIQSCTLHCDPIPVKKDIIGKCISRGAEWHKIQLRSTFK